VLPSKSSVSDGVEFDASTTVNNPTPKSKGFLMIYDFFILF